jgi:cytochrome oxidase Cu insertion factor (SCO1/SenC/PrrC family)
MTAQSSPIHDVSRRRPSLLWVLLVAAVVGVAGGVVAALSSRSSSPSRIVGGPAATWAAGARPAPGFTLHDQHGQSVSVATLQGRAVLLTFIDPLCRNFCPLEAKVLNAVVDSLSIGKRPTIVAVSVNPWGNARPNLLDDSRKWQLVPEWRWAIGSPAALAGVWRKYAIGVQATTKTIAGVTVHEISHTEASYLIDPSGHERALFLWPFKAAEVERAIASLGSS